jgi:hypothetical protein
VRRNGSAFRFSSEYLKEDVFDELDDVCDKILAEIAKMIEQSERWVIKTPESTSRA